MSYLEKKEVENALIGLFERMIYGLLVGADTKSYKKLEGLNPENRVDIHLAFICSDDLQDYIDNKITEVELSKRLGTDGMKELASSNKTDLHKLRPKIRDVVEKLIDKYKDNLI